MSSDTLQMMENMDRRSLDTQLALQCAPVLAGIKVSNLLNISQIPVEDVKRRLAGSSISVSLLYLAGPRATLLLYWRPALEAYLNREDVKALLAVWGYTAFGLEAVLERFSQRYQSCRESGDWYPHEVGLLLGYPVEDVRGFVENQGRNFLYSGYWKVYANRREAEALFALYEDTRALAVRMLAEKRDIRELWADGGLPETKICKTACK